MKNFLLASLLLQSAFVFAQVNPEAKIVCDNGTVDPDAPRIKFYQCMAKHGSRYVPNFRDTWDYPTGWVMPNPPLPKMPIAVRLDGDTPAYPPAGINNNYSEINPNGFVVKLVYSHYPDWTRFAPANNPDLRPLDWGGASYGNNSNGWRLAGTLSKIAQSGYSVDINAGVALTGQCYGGAAAFHQALMLPDPYWQKHISIVHVDTPGMLMVNHKVDVTLPGGNPRYSEGYYFRNPAMPYAWGSYNIAKADYLNPINLGKVDHIYFRAVGAVIEDDIGFARDFFKKVCDGQRVACYGQWYRSNHDFPDPNPTTPKWYKDSMGSRYSGPDMYVRLDLMLPIFTNSTANDWGPYGHYNMGLEWSNAKSSYIDTPTRISIPIRYRRRTGMVNTKDQPPSVKFDFTVRRTQKFELPLGKVLNWSLQQEGLEPQSGQITVTKAGDLTIPGVRLKNNNKYTNIVITEAATPARSP
ncbi:MAG: hypothetical protein R3E50_09475 [Halioglobus sp.]